MARNLEDGLADHPEREPDDWKDIPSHFVDGPYRSALLRHYGRREWAAVAVNAAILFWHDRKKQIGEMGNT